MNTTPATGAAIDMGIAALINIKQKY